MALYTYKAIDPEGRAVQGRLDALNLVDLEMRLKRMELDLISSKTVRNSTLFVGSKITSNEIINL